VIGTWALIAAARAWGAEGVEAPELGGRYLVVVASKRSLGELDPSMEAAARIGIVLLMVILKMLPMTMKVMMTMMMTMMVMNNTK
jgi:hypothetical protein